ncbi:hypothetical protein [Mariniblastus fucicola]|uniref:Uncharacterized protein n=1 Tax=Mariniblastus fucicola TaxID=980251 RepID=A0A5B9PLU1_9BACT|nr:hypothetical protein [Mariniblastus fucicola]QEG23253.1 hypothetical protein MFFC18_31490 [Mariniblastus fucicola]
MLVKKVPFLILLLCVCVSGCGDSVDSQISNATKHNIRKVAIMYMVYSSANKFVGPKDEAEFKAWIQGDPSRKERLERFGINTDEFDSYMVSDRTGDKFEIRWGVKSAPMAPAYPVAFEPNAVDGVRHVGMAGGETREVSDDDEYNDLWEGKVTPDDSEGAERGNS